MTMIEWTDVDPARFETYPSPKPLKGPDASDDVIEAVAAGKTVKLTLVDESAVRGRRLALGRRAKRVGLEIEMCYSENRLVVRQKRGATDAAANEPAAPESNVISDAEPDVQPPRKAARGSRRAKS